MITNRALNSMANGYRNVPAYLVVGSGGDEVLATDDVLSGEFERIELDSFDVVDNSVRFYGSRSGSLVGDDLITNLGVTQSSSLGSSDLEAGSLISSLIHSSDFDLSTEFWFTFERS